MIISIDAEKDYKIQHLFMKKKNPNHTKKTHLKTRMNEMEKIKLDLYVFLHTK